jgi:predicted enzyme related to lactoylglutathione lyase
VFGGPASEAPTVRMDAVSLATADPPALARFYARLFDLGEPRTEPDGMMGFQIGTSFLGFEQRSTVSTYPSRATVWFTVPDAALAHNRALAAGARSGAGSAGYTSETRPHASVPDRTLLTDSNL